MRYSKEKPGVGKELLDEGICCYAEEGGSQEAPFPFPQSSTCTPKFVFHWPGELVEREEGASFVIVNSVPSVWEPQSGMKC